MGTLARASCEENGWAFPETFWHQYLITPASEAKVDGWVDEDLGGWRVNSCPDLPKTLLKLGDGTVAGVVLGFAISTDGQMLDGSYKLPVKARTTDKMADAERHVAQLAGRYVVLLCIGDEARVYPDPACSLGPVYSPVSRRLAASTTLVINRKLRDNPEVPAADVARGAAYYRFGHTADAEVRRARSNHYIDLSDFSLHRHWPLPETEFDLGDAPISALAGEIAAKLARNMAALAGRYPCALPVTGGTDSRILLASAVDIFDQIDRFFVYYASWSSSNDCILARQIAEALALPLQVVARDAPSFAKAITRHDLQTVLAKRRLRNGLEPDTADPRSVQAMELVPERHLVLRGNVCEMTRALRWARPVFDDPHRTEHALNSLLLKKPQMGDRYGYWEDRFLQWKATLPDNALPRIYDLVHTELWLPHTNSLVYTAETRVSMINPFNDRRLIAATMRVPAVARKRGRLVNQIVRKRLPEISNIPYMKDYIAEQRRQRRADKTA